MIGVTSRNALRSASKSRRQIGQVYSGQAVLSRFRLRQPTRHALPQPTNNGRLYNLFYLHRAVQGVFAELGGGVELHILNAHLEAFDVDRFVEALLGD